MQRPDNSFLQTFSCCSFGDEHKFSRKSNINFDDLVVREDLSGISPPQRSSLGEAAGLPDYWTPAPSGLQNVTPRSEGFSTRHYVWHATTQEGTLARPSERGRKERHNDEWDRTKAYGAAAVDLSNLLINPQKPSAINIWQVSLLTRYGEWDLRSPVNESTIQSELLVNFKRYRSPYATFLNFSPSYDRRSTTDYR